MDEIFPVDFHEIKPIEVDSIKNPIETLEVGVIKDLAFKIAAIQQKIAPIITNPSLLILASDSSILETLNTESCKALQNLFKDTSLLEAYNSNKEVNITYYDIGLVEDCQCNKLNREFKIERRVEKPTINTTMEVLDYEKCIIIGETLVHEKKEEASNIIGFGCTGKDNKLPAALLTSNLANIPIEQCISFEKNSNTHYSEIRMELLCKVQKKRSPMTLVEVMTSFGSLEMAVMAGAFLKAASLRMIILIDGFVSAAALLYAYQFNEHVLDYCIFCNQSGEKGQQIIIDYFEKQTILQLATYNENGLGVLMAYPIIKGAAEWLNKKA